MANLTVSGDSDYSSTGTPDTFTPVSDGPSGTDAVAAHINGIATAITELQALAGNALTLKGSVADLVARLSRVIHADGALAKGTAFPGTPIDGQPFYRTDLNTLYIYDAGTTSWALGLDDGTFALIDGTRDFTGDIKVRKSTPAVRLCGTEASANDVLIREQTGVLYFYKNTGSEGAPTWTEFFNINGTTGAITTLLTRLTGSGAFKAILTHANTADRTYTLPNFNWDFLTGTVFKGPTSCGSGSTRSHEGSVTVSSNGNYSGIHFYTDFTLNSGVTMTVPAGTRRLIIIASETITINGTINASGAGASGYIADSFTVEPGSDQPGGGSTANVSRLTTLDGTGTGLSYYQAGVTGGAVRYGSSLIQAGGATAGTQVTGSAVLPVHLWMEACGGGAGAGESHETGIGNAGQAGGAGGGSLVLIAPTIVLASTATLNTSGSNGASGSGGGGAGNVYITARSFTDNGCTFTQTAGTAGGGGGGAGAAGVKQINIYS